MTKTPRRLLLTLALSPLLAATPFAVAQADYPNRPIRLLVPYAAGGNSDILARIVAERIGRNMGQAVIVENKAGAGGSLATAEVARAASDGYTLLLGTSSTHAINPAVYTKLRYDAQKDFAPITTLALSEYALVVPASSPFRTVQEMLSSNAKQPLRFASNGNGTTSHLAAALVGVKTGNEFIHVPYKSSSPAMTDLMGGQVDFLIDNTSTALQNLPTGKLRILATTGSERSASTRNVPTMREAGVPDYEVIGWWVIVAPAGTPAPVVERLNREITKAVADPDIKKRMVDMGNEPFIKSPAETSTFIASEMKKFRGIAESVHLQLD